ncbi:Uncharacterised protein [Kingella kingae]|uniref:hypothetical protein n=1 Tax=Kingella kingae TaxID=504 RepID=UPI000DFA48BA|nr:hypothetical protein [Kingella kingae]QIP47946.1 hypothetical protein HBA47_08430 [Kingella kingae]STR02216.1 Uncharacterised protein [Kingella kingae]
MNPHLQYLAELNQAAQQFWQAFQAKLPHLRTLDMHEFVEQGNEVLHEYLPDISLVPKKFRPKWNAMLKICP